MGHYDDIRDEYDRARAGGAHLFHPTYKREELCSMCYLTFEDGNHRKRTPEEDALMIPKDFNDHRMCECGVYLRCHPHKDCDYIRPLPPMPNDFELGYNLGAAKDPDFEAPPAQMAWNQYCLQRKDNNG